MKKFTIKNIICTFAIVLWVVAMNAQQVRKLVNSAEISKNTQNELVKDVRFDITLDTNLNIPTAFSPNSDGVNDTFVVPILKQYLNHKIEIFNRWGNKVYDYSNKGKIDITWWNGYTTNRLTSNKSEQAPTGNYYYIIYFNDGVKDPITGWIYLIK